MESSSPGWYACPCVGFRLPRLPRSRAGGVIAFGALTLLGLVAALLAAATVLLQGERLARVITRVLPDFEGKLTVEAVYWQPRLFLDLLTDRPTPIEIRGLRITDPEGVEVLRTP